jgi:CubicO group peptidase (beta-lactamase class C family)
MINGSILSLRLLALVAVILIASCGARADKVDDFLKAELARQRIPGMAVAVIQGGKVVKAEGYGFANLELKVPVTADTVFQLGSVGKQFTAGAVMLLVQDGKIRLEDPVGKHLDFAPEAWKEVTVRHLLTHTSGIPDYTGLVDLRVDASAEQTAKKITDKPLDFAPGTKWQYSNSNYLLLGVLIEKASGEFYGDLLKERVFTPLDMTTARINSESDLIPNRAAGYEFRAGQLRNQAYVPPLVNTYADGSLIMSVRDMAKWDLALYTDKPFPKAVRDQMWTPARLTDGKATTYGYGWQLGERNGHRSVGHGGAWQGFTATILRYPDDRLSVVVLTNRAGANPGTIALKVAEMYLPALAPKEVPLPAPEPKVIELVKTVLKEVADNKLSQDRFTLEMWDALKGSGIASVSGAVRALGAVQEVTILEKKEQNGERIYRIRVAFARAKNNVLMTLTKDDKISGMLLSPE